MGTYNLPRNVKGEGRILYVFSTKALLYAFAGALVGFFILLFLKALNMTFIGYMVILAFGAIGFAIATFKVPETNAFEITKKTGGEKIDDVIKRGLKFKMNKNKVYIYTMDSKKKNEKKTKQENGGDM